MVFIFGKNRFKLDEYIYWDSKRVINPHILAIGSSGSGKTTFLKNFVNFLSKNKSLAIHIFDVHGDIKIEGSHVKRFRFSESSNESYGFNPFIISSDPDFGGVRKKVVSFISSLNRTSRKLGHRQENILAEILYDIYAANGFYYDDPKTWTLDYDPRRHSKYPKKYPTLDDVIRYTEFKLKQLYLGVGSTASLKHLDTLHRTVESIRRYEKKKNKSSTEDEKRDIEDRIENLKEKCINSYTEYIRSVDTGKELEDLFKYGDYEKVKSILDHLVNLSRAGIFKDKHPELAQDKNVGIYSIESLNRDEQQLFIDLYIENLFLRAKEKGQQNRLKTLIVIDESYLFISKEQDHILNVLIREGRKFGIGVILASQTLGDFSEEILSNTATKVILGVDEINFKNLQTKLKINESSLKYLEPRKTALVRIKEESSFLNKYVSTVLNYSLNNDNELLEYLDV